MGCLSGRHASQMIRLDEGIAGNSITSVVQEARSDNPLVHLGPRVFISVHCESIVFNQTSLCFHERAKCFSQVHNADLSSVILLSLHVPSQCQWQISMCGDSRIPECKENSL